MKIIIESEGESREIVEVDVDGIIYTIMHDQWTGDWCVTSDGDRLVQEDYFRTKDGAIGYALESAGVLDSPYYSRSPERC